MRKRVLIIEAADAIRGVAESILRQNGYEVVAVSSGDKAKEVLQYARPDLIVLGADLKAPDQTPLYDKFRDDPRTTSIPLVLFEPVEPMDLPFPPEVIVSRPVEPRDFLQKVKTFSGLSEFKSNHKAPSTASSIDDEFLDAALGLDHIDVTDSEVLDRTSVGIKIPTPTSINRSTQIGQDDQGTESHNDSNRVETLMIHDDQSEIMRRSGKLAAPQTQKPHSGTGKLEIMSDQYGMVDPEALKIQRQDQQHDYDWFVNSMREEYSGQPKSAGPANPASLVKSPESQSLNFASNSSLLDPHTPGPAMKVESKSISEQNPARSRGADVERFIDEFKREIEVLKSAEPEAGFANLAADAPTPQGQTLAWEESVENITPQQVELFSKQLAKELGERIAEKIVAKIDSDKLLQLIKSEIIAKTAQRRRS